MLDALPAATLLIYPGLKQAPNMNMLACIPSGLVAYFLFPYYNHTTIVLQPFVRDYPSEPVQEEKNTHPTTILIIIQSLSASSIYYDP